MLTDLFMNLVKIYHFYCYQPSKPKQNEKQKCKQMVQNDKRC